MDTRTGQRITRRTAFACFLIFIISFGAQDTVCGWNTIVVAALVYVASAIITAFVLAFFS